MKSLRNLFFVAVLIAVPAFAQELTSDITGTVSNSAGNAISGASVTVTYTPTNSSSTKSTNSDGRFSAGGLKPGGPYEIQVRSGSYNTETIEGLILIVFFLMQF